MTRMSGSRLRVSAWVVITVDTEVLRMLRGLDAII